MSARQTPAPQAGGSSALLPAMTQQQEDSIIHTRITNDEKALRRVAKKFYNYTAVAYNTAVPTAGGSTSADDARDTFLLELASFHLSLKKSLMVCEAEARQIEEYQRERERIENERASLTEQIEGLKVSLEQAQLQRRRKIEYDVIAEKVNALPSREELEQSITAIENDILAIQAEHENQNGILQAQQSALEVVITSIQDLRLMGKQDADVTETSRPGTPLLSSQADNDVEMEPRARAETGELLDDQAEVQDARGLAGSTSQNKLLNPAARAFMPQSSSPSTPLLHSLAGTPLPTTENQPKTELEEGEDEDIEMGELAEDPVEKIKKKAREEELEEGEASDMSSELSEPPDD